MKQYLPKLLLASILSFGLLVFSVSGAQAATFSLSPASGSTVSGTFTVTLNLTLLAGEQVSGIDVYMNYEPSKLEALEVDVSNGIFSNYVDPQIDSANEKIKIFASAPGALSPVTQSGTIAEISFKALQTSGSTTLSFDYTAGSTIDSNVTEAGTETDLLTQPPTVTYNFGTSTTTTTATTTTPPAGNGVGETPEGGITDPTVLVSFLSMGMVGAGLALRIKKRTALSFEERILSQN